MVQDQITAPGDRPNPGRRFVNVLPLAVFFVVAGLLHFLRPEFYVRIMPAFLPWPVALVYVSGVLEVLGGIAILPLRTRRPAGYGLIALLVAVFPANVNMAMHPAPIAGWDVPLWLLWLRLPLQAVFIAWVWWATNAGKS